MERVAVIEGVGLGILSWRDRASLGNALGSYQRADLFSLFEERLVFFAEQCDEDHQLAGQFGLPSTGVNENLGILGGFEALADAMTSDYILLVENDCPLIADLAEAKNQISAGLRLLQQGEVQVVRLRSTREPGELFSSVDKYRRYHAAGFAPYMRRLIRPQKARQLSSLAIYDDAGSLVKFPDIYLKTDEETEAGPIYKVSSRYLNWTNQSILISRSFFLGKVIGYAKTHPTRRRVNGFRNLEIEMNSDYWRQSGWFVGLPYGLFTHKRTGQRGY